MLGNIKTCSVTIVNCDCDIGMMQFSDCLRNALYTGCAHLSIVLVITNVGNPGEVFASVVHVETGAAKSNQAILLKHRTRND
jgi:hypothetical protein